MMTDTGDTASGQVIGLSGPALDQLMPLHVWLAPGAQIVRAGPTVQKMVGDPDLQGRSLFDVMTMLKPRLVTSLPDMLALAGQRLTVSLTSAEELRLRAMVVALPGDTGALMNLSLGVSFARAVERWGLTLTDFSPCDHTVDLLYLREATAAASQQSRRMTERLQRAKLTAEEEALTDTLTGLSNRRALDRALQRVLLDPEARFGLMHLDLDFFKQVNDSHGHAAGDCVLTHVAEILTAEVRRSDIVARVGGDEFMLLFRGCDDPDLLDTIANRLIRKLEEPTIFGGHACRVSASIGTTLSRYYTAPTVPQVLRDADLALYASKHGGRARHTFYTPSLAGASAKASRE